MDLVEVQKRLLTVMATMKTVREGLKKRAMARSKSMARFHRNLAVCIMKLRSGETIQSGDQIFKDVSATNAEKIAMGICWRDIQAMELADTQYKAAIQILRNLEAELNALQSYKRHFDTM